MSLLSYRRSGGGRPLLNEELTVDEDGAFVLLRRSGVHRVGRFAGRLPDAELAELMRLVAALPAPVPVEDRPRLPGAVAESVVWSGGTASFPFEDPEDREDAERATAPWLALRPFLRRLCEDGKASPVAALELRVDPSGRRAVLEALGSEAAAVVLADAEMALALFAEDDYLASATVPLPDGVDGPWPSGRRVELPLEHGLAFTPGRTLSVVVALDEVEEWPGRLTASAGPVTDD